MPNQPAAMLVFEKGAGDSSVLPLEQQAYVLGKRPAADIALDNPHVSRRHAEIALKEGRFQIRDLGSKNGTFVNGSLLGNQELWLHSGDRIELARGQVVLRFQEWGTTITLPPIDRASPGDLVVDSRAREVWIRESKLEPPLSRKEFDVLNLLYQRKGDACSKDDIASEAWAERKGGDVGDQEIEQCIRRLRLRVEPDPSQPSYIVNVRGYGYKLSQG